MRKRGDTPVLALRKLISIFCSVAYSPMSVCYALLAGKFQMQVLPQVGHAVHEDNPDRVAEVLATFMVRHKVAEAKDHFQR